MSSLFAKYVHRPTEVLAAQYDGTNGKEIMEWLNSQDLFVGSVSYCADESGTLFIQYEGDRPIELEVGTWMVIFEDDDDYRYAIDISGDSFMRDYKVMPDAV